MSDTSVAPTLELAQRLIFAAFEVLKENGGEMRGRDVREAAGARVELNEWAKARFEKSGYIRWESILHFYTIDCVKAGFLVKKRGVWHLTPEGEATIALGGAGILDKATAAYRKWRTENPKPEVAESTEPEVGVSEEVIAMEEIQQVAADGLENHIRAKNPYEFQDLAAALMRGMGYYTPFVAPKGKDGGIDIAAYRDPLGTESPRIKVQVKHRETAATIQEIRQLMGILRKDGDVGIFISTGGFTSDAKYGARDSLVHVELIDLPRFLELWQEFFPKLDDEDKARLPLMPVYFLASVE